MPNESTLPLPIYATRPVVKTPHWRGLVSLDLLLNSLGTGLYLAAAVCHLLAPDRFAPLAVVAYPIAFFLVVADLVVLVVDLGDPLRFHHMLRVQKPKSVISVGTWSLSTFAGALFLVVAAHLLPAGLLPAWLPRLLVLLACFPALSSAIYKGILLSITAQPGWREARWLGGYLANSALVLGAAQMLVLAVLLRPQAAGFFRAAIVVLLLLNLVPKGLLAANLGATLTRLYRRQRIVAAGVLLFGVGVLLPVLLLIFGSSPVPLLLAALAILLESLALRLVVVRLPHAVQAI